MARGSLSQHGRDEARGIGGGPPSPPNAILTRRELQIVAAIADGLSNGEIATKLGLKPQTVRNHLNVVFEKLHVRSRLQLAVKAIREKIVD